MKALEAGDKLAAEARKAHDGTRCDAFADGCECGKGEAMIEPSEEPKTVRQ